MILGPINCVFLAFFVWIGFFVQISRSDSLYSEGFYSKPNELPGGPAAPDSSNGSTPNLPFSTDTNRYSDGHTSTAAYETTSPHFPPYKGSPANVSDRFKHYTLYVESAAEQGIATYGAGDQVREAARLKILKQPNYLDIPPPSKKFSVYAAIKWNPSDFAIQEGETYNISVQGSQIGYTNQSWNDGGIRVNADGYSSYFDAVSNCYVGLGRCRPHLKKRRRLPTANWMALACSIGEFVRPLTEIQPGEEATYRWMPLDESSLVQTIFVVGQQVQFRAVYTGQLICFANDAHTLYWNNYGELEVTVTRASWPPQSDLVYEDYLLPACDSAFVVYQNQTWNASDPNSHQPKCNIKGNGAGWKEADIISKVASFGSGAPESVLYDLSPEERNQRV